MFGKTEFLPYGTIPSICIWTDIWKYPTLSKWYEHIFSYEDHNEHIHAKTKKKDKIKIKQKQNHCVYHFSNVMCLETRLQVHKLVDM